MRPIACCLILTLLVTSCAPPSRIESEDPAASRSDVEVGDHVKLALVDGTEVSGRVRWVASDALRVGEATVAWEDVARLEREGGPNWVPFVIAAAALVAVGLVLIIRDAEPSTGY